MASRELGRLSDTAGDADFAPIRRALDGVDVIFLGESSHGDGGGHLARARLVRYLHEQLGFDVIAWEAGVREAVAFDSLLGTNAPLSRITPLALSPWWAPSAELRPVLEYVRQTRQRGFARMATMTGASRDSVEDALEHTWLEAAADLRQRFVAQRTSFVRALGQRDTELLGRVLENVAANAEQMRLARDADPAKRIASYNLREQRNAENLLWLLRECHRGEKIIVWSHNVHAINARFTARFDGVSLDPSTAPRDATARIVKDSMGGRSYSVAIVSFDGTWGFPGGDRTELPFLDIRGKGRAVPSWLSEPMMGTLNTQSPAHYPVVWPRVVDGVLFVDRMTPSGVVPD